MMLMAFEATHIDDALNALGFEQTEEKDKFNEHSFSVTQVSENKYLIWDNTLMGDREITSSDATSDLVVMQVCETTMSGFVERWSNGSKTWEIDYSGCDDPKEFYSSDKTPSEVLDIYKTLKSEQHAAEDGDQVDYVFGTLSQTFEKLTGFNYELSNDFEFFKLKKISRPKKKSWWRFSS